MSIKLMSEVWELALPHSQLLVALALADHGNDDGSSIYPSLGLVAWKCGYSDRQVRRIVRDLEAAGLLLKVSEATEDRGVEYRMIAAAGKPKPPRKGADKMSGAVKTSGRTRASGGGGHSDPGGADTAMSAKPSTEPSQNQPPAKAGGVAAAPPADPLAADIDRLCTLMSEQLRTVHNIQASSKECRVARGWPGACKALLTIDGYTVTQVEFAIAWVLRNNYWRRRIKSMTRLRQEMAQVATELHEEAERRRGRLAPSADPLAGLSESQRARLRRTAARTGVPIDQLTSRPTQPQVGGPHAPNPDRGTARGAGLEAGTSAQQPALAGSSAA